MLKFLHVIAIGGLIASAGYVYRVKYDTLYQQEEVAKLRSAVKRERDVIAVLRAEWQMLDRPERIQALVSHNLDLQPLNVGQFARLDEIPMRQHRGDEIGKKLELLGLAQPTETPRDTRPGATRTGPTRTSATRPSDLLTTGSIRSTPNAIRPTSAQPLNLRPNP